ncbi:trans-aconitate methyltransferase 1 [Tieghemiomyces parasiticus]|uniref:Trans-aconitate methyltransferase 1 n=1 Tax=Tieghemiomyces parasiticus TaxID=78921 RepID=A0A9W8E1G1_9FUNG|nr:trans-aconitate methyltransferase 1 [Tieghemiomyces parasiticus]
MPQPVHSAFALDDFQSDVYQDNRPNYESWLTEKMIAYSLSHNIGRAKPHGSPHFFNVAVDLATGTGQMTALLSNVARQVYAMDVSVPMIAAAVPRPNVTYSIHRAEGPWNPAIAPHSVDLVTVATAAHWFKRPDVWQQIHRMLRPGGTLALVNYIFPGFPGRSRATAMLWALADSDKYLGKYWDQGRFDADTLLGSWDLPFDGVKRYYYPAGLVSAQHCRENSGDPTAEPLPTSTAPDHLQRIHENQTGNGLHLPSSSPIVRMNMSPTQIEDSIRTWSGYKRFCDVHPDRANLAHEYVEEMMAAEGCTSWNDTWEADWNSVFILATNPDCPTA